MSTIYYRTSASTSQGTSEHRKITLETSWWRILRECVCVSNGRPRCCGARTRFYFPFKTAVDVSDAVPVSNCIYTRRDDTHIAPSQGAASVRFRRMGTPARDWLQPKAGIGMREIWRIIFGVYFVVNVYVNILKGLFDHYHLNGNDQITYQKTGFFNILDTKNTIIMNKI